MVLFASDPSNGMLTILRDTICPICKPNVTLSRMSVLSSDNRDLYTLHETCLAAAEDVDKWLLNEKSPSQLRPGIDVLFDFYLLDTTTTADRPTAT